jgi:hypothetical protein
MPVQTVIIVILSFVVTLATLFTIRAVRSEKTRTTWLSVVFATRWWMLPVALADVGLKIALTALLWQVEFFRFGWWALAASLPVDLPTLEESDTTVDTVAVIMINCFLLAIPVLLLIAMPLIAHASEKFHRIALEEKIRVKRFWFAVNYGITQLSIGMPWAVATATIVSGFIYTRVNVHHVNKYHVEAFGSTEETAKALKTHKERFTQSYDSKTLDQHLSDGTITKIIYLNRDIAHIVTAAVHSLSNTILLVVILIWLAVLALAG